MYLLDTNVVREMSGPNMGNKSVSNWLAGVDNSKVYFSIAVIMELHKGLGLEKRNRNADAAKVSTGERRIKGFIETHWDSFIHANQQIAAEWGRLRGGKEQDDADMLIAATANVKNLIVVTRNVTHFEKRVKNVLDPFKPAKPTRGSR